MKTVRPETKSPIHNENLKNLNPYKGKGSILPATKISEKPHISETAKTRNSEMPSEDPLIAKDANEVSLVATGVAKSLAKLPILPIIIPSENKDSKKLEEKILDQKTPKLNYVKKPAVIFIEGFSAFGISNGDGIKDMAENLPGAKRFSWDEQEKIIEEIKKHSPEQPVVLVGHSFGGDSAVEIANTLNTVKNGFRSIDLIVSVDSVGMNHSIIPMNVKRNLNFFGEGIVPLLHGDPNVARNTDYSEVINELRSELHSKMEDSNEVQFKIFESINEVLSEFTSQDLFTEMQKNEHLKSIIDSQLPNHLKD
jgi:hypothetical protein